MNTFLLHYHDNTTDVSRYSAMSVAIKCKIVMRLELSLGRWQGFDKGDGRRQRLGGDYLATGLGVEQCLKYCRNGGRCRGWGAHIQAPIDEEASSIPVGHNGPETQSCMRAAGRLSTGLNLPSGNCRWKLGACGHPRSAFPFMTQEAESGPTDISQSNSFRDSLRESQIVLQCGSRA